MGKVNPAVKLAAELLAQYEAEIAKLSHSAHNMTGEPLHRYYYARGARAVLRQVMDTADRDTFNV